jgi:hypothetical protein
MFTRILVGSASFELDELAMSDHVSARLRGRARAKAVRIFT